MSKSTLRRSNDAVIAGVCGAIAERLGWDPTRFRIAFVILTVLSVGFPALLIYALLWFVMPAPLYDPAQTWEPESPQAV